MGTVNYELPLRRHPRRLAGTSTDRGTRLKVLVERAQSNHCEAGHGEHAGSIPNCYLLGERCVLYPPHITYRTVIGIHAVPDSCFAFARAHTRRSGAQSSEAVQPRDATGIASMALPSCFLAFLIFVLRITVAVFKIFSVITEVVCRC